MRSILLALSLVLGLVFGTGCASGPDPVETIRLTQQVQNQRLRTLETAEPGVTEAELQKRLEDFEQTVRRTYGQAAFEALGRDMDLVASRYGQFEQRLERLESWLNRSRTKTLVEGGDISVFENPPATALPEPKCSEKEIEEFMPAVNELLDTAQRHHDSELFSLASFWLGEAVRELGGRKTLLLQRLGQSNRDKRFVAWAQRELQPGVEAAP